MNLFLYERILIYGTCVYICSGLQKYLNQLGFHIVGYGCTTCIGNSGDIDESVASAITENGNYLCSSGMFDTVLWYSKNCVANDI